MTLILALLGWIGTSRLVRAEVLSLRERDYIVAGRALGASALRLTVFHMLPNLISILIVTGSIIAGNLILLESGLSYLASAFSRLRRHGATCSLTRVTISPQGYIWWYGPER